MPGRVAIEIPGPLGQRPRRMRATWLRASFFWIALGRDVLDRAVNVVLALVALLALSPLLVVRALAGFVATGRVVTRVPFVGRYRERYERLAFSGSWPLAGLAALLNVLRGDMAFAGPRPLTEDEARSIPPSAVVRFDLRPGLISPYVLRRKTGIAYDAETAVDREFFYGQSVGSDVGLVARALPGMLLGGGETREAPPTLDLFGITITNTTMDEAIGWIIARARRTEPAQLCFVNPDCLNIAYRDESYRAVLRDASRVLPDGIGVHLACRMMGTSLAANVNGTDLFPRLAETIAGTDLALYFLGAKPGIAAECADKMRVRFPALRIAGVRDGYFTAEQADAVIDAINDSGASILLVAMGAPRQDLWIARHRDRLRVPVAMGVGGLFDYYSGRIARAPIWMREIGLEWLWRTMQEPGRLWKRYFIGNPLFLSRVWRNHVRGR